MDDYSRRIYYRAGFGYCLTKYNQPLCQLDSVALSCPICFAAAAPTYITRRVLALWVVLSSSLSVLAMEFSERILGRAEKASSVTEREGHISLSPVFSDS